MDRDHADRVVGLILAKRKKPGGGGGDMEEGDYRGELEGAMEEFLTAVQAKDAAAMADAFELAHELCAKASGDMEENEHKSGGMRAGNSMHSDKEY